MPSTYSNNLRLELIASGEQGNTWGNTTNNNLGTLIEQAISGYRSVDTVWSSNACTLTSLNGANDQARNMFLDIPSGVLLTAQGELIAPTVPKMYVIRNNSSGGFAVRIKTGSSSTTCLIPNGTTKAVVCDGTNFSEATTAAAAFYIANAPTTSLQATNKSYVDTADNLRLKLDGTQNMTGELILSAGTAPSNALGAVSKQYVTSTFLPLAGGTLTGALTLPSVAPVGTWQAVPKTYVDAFAISASAPLSSSGTAGTGISMSIATATASARGVVKGGGNVSIAADGTMSVTGIGAGTVTNVSGTSPISVANGTTTPSISITLASSVASGYLSSTDWTTFNSKMANSGAAVTSALGYTPYNAANISSASVNFATSAGSASSASSASSATTATTATYLSTISRDWSTLATSAATTNPYGVSFRTATAGAASVTCIQSNNTGSSGAALAVARTNSTHTGGVDGTLVAFFYGTNAISGAGIASGGSGTTITYATGSDYRLKQNVENIDSPLSKVETLKPISFEFISNPGHRVEGFLAHELAEVIPYAVTGSKDAIDEEGNPEYQGVDQAKLVPLLVAAIKELNEKVNALTVEVEALKGA